MSEYGTEIIRNQRPLCSFKEGQLKRTSQIIFFLVLGSLVAQYLSSEAYRSMESAEPAEWTRSLEGMQRKTLEYHLQAGVNHENDACLYLRVTNSLLSAAAFLCILRHHKLLKEFKKVQLCVKGLQEPKIWEEQERWPFRLLRYLEAVLCVLHSPPKLEGKLVQGLEADAFLLFLSLSKFYLLFVYGIVDSKDTSIQERAILMEKNGLDSLQKVWRFQIRQRMNQNAFGFLIACFGAFLLAFTLAIQACEIPLSMHSGHDWTHFFTGLWYVAITALTIGYGDMVAYSPFGKFLSIFAVLIAQFFLASVLYSIGARYRLRTEEKYALEQEGKQTAQKAMLEQAARLIQLQFRYHHLHINKSTASKLFKVGFLAQIEKQSLYTHGTLKLKRKYIALLKQQAEAFAEAKRAYEKHSNESPFETKLYQVEQDQQEISKQQEQNCQIERELKQSRSFNAMLQNQIREQKNLILDLRQSQKEIVEAVKEKRELQEWEKQLIERTNA